jgi:hypothetical protein
MARNLSKRETRRRGRLVKLSSLAVLIASGVASFSTPGWAGGDGYGPGGGPGGGRGGGFGDVIVVETVGPSGASVLGRFHGTTVDLVISPGEFSTDELVGVTSFTPDCRVLRDQHVVIGFGVFVIVDGHTKQALTGPATVTVSSPRISSSSLIYSVDHDRCTALNGLTVSQGHVTVPLSTSSAFVITTAVHAKRDTDDDNKQATTRLFGVFHHEWTTNDL